MFRLSDSHWNDFRDAVKQQCAAILSYDYGPDGYSAMDYILLSLFIRKFHKNKDFQTNLG